MEFLIIVAIWSGIFGVACYSIAAAKNLDAGLYAVIGAILGIVGLIIVACMPAKKDA